MIDAIVGAVIMVAATSSLVLALEVAQRAFEEAGRYPLNAEEERLLDSVGVVSPGDLEKFWGDNVFVLPREIGD